MPHSWILAYAARTGTTRTVLASHLTCSWCAIGRVRARSCFYRHAYPDGRLEPREVVLRTARTDEGETRVLRPLTLSAFLDTPHASALLSGARRR